MEQWNESLGLRSISQTPFWCGSPVIGCDDSQSLLFEREHHLNQFNCNLLQLEEFVMVLENVPVQEPKPAQAAEILKSIFTRKVRKKNGSRFYTKNICRYMIQQALRVLQETETPVRLICERNQTPYPEFKAYYLSQRSTLQGVQLFRKHLLTNSNDSPDIRNRKFAFKEFMSWYMENYAIRHLLRGKNKTDVRQYLNYKNYVMSYMIACPEGQAGNSVPTWALQIDQRYQD